MTLIRFDGSDIPDRLPLPARRHLQAWYHLFPANSEVPADSHEASMREVSRILTNRNVAIDDSSNAYLRVTLRRLDGRRETITFTEGKA